MLGNTFGEFRPSQHKVYCRPAPVPGKFQSRAGTRSGGLVRLGSEAAGGAARRKLGPKRR